MSGAEEERKRAARAEQVALFRYQLIREAADPALSTRQRGRMVREIASKAHEGPFGEPVTVSRGTIDRWIRAWREGGFAALAPPARQVTPADGRGGPGDGSGAEAGEPGPDRRPGAADPGEVVRLVAVGADAAAALRAAGAPAPGRTGCRRRCSAGSSARRRTRCGPATPCTARASRAGRRTCSASSTTTRER